MFTVDDLQARLDTAIKPNGRGFTMKDQAERIDCADGYSVSTNGHCRSVE